MATRRRPRIRKIIDSFAGVNRAKSGKYIDSGEVFLVPASSVVDGYYVVVWFPPLMGKPEQFLCSCPSYRYQDQDRCKHTEGVKEQLDVVRAGSSSNA